jgi:hypothetical protein
MQYQSFLSGRVFGIMKLAIKTLSAEIIVQKK